jgi:hypothetical protein
VGHVVRMKGQDTDTKFSAKPQTKKRQDIRACADDGTILRRIIEKWDLGSSASG